MASEAGEHEAPRRGRFIVLEGGEGAGKSTQAQRLAEWLRARGRAPLLTREPGGCPLAEAVRAIVLQDWSPAPDVLTEALLMFAARREHLRQVIEPALAEGRDVICDRFVDASYAYQGAARGLAQDAIATLERMVLEGRRADLVLLLDIDPENGATRVRARGHANRFDAADLAVQQRIRAAYLQRAAADPARYCVCDATAAVDRVTAALRSRVAALLGIAE
jgi:thymidylate kinase (EC 2.7.4.9)